MNFYATDIDLALERVDAMLRDLGVPAHTGACKCVRCERRDAPAEASGEPATPDLPGGALVENPHPAPVKPPSSIKLTLATLPRDSYRERHPVADEISF